MKLFNSLVPRLVRTSEPRASNTATREPEYTVKPLYDLNETTEAWALTVHLPGVTKEGLDLSVEEGLLSIRGHRAWMQPEGWTQLYRESVNAPFALTLEHDNSVDTDRIRAELKDGVLRITLPKTEAVKPRKIVIE
ncbi:MAG: Hsp20/alpha crystallin family protein [Candidatus Didemnitutus sp.]|nr:Hsp20/alpha crystallin family protein [Candidatus Didemnitutus sp.]